MVVYLGALAAMLVNSFFYLDGFTGQVVREFTLQTYAKLLHSNQCADFRPYDAHGALCDAGLHRDCVSAFVLHGAFRLAAAQDASIHGGDAAAVVELCGAGLLVEADPGAGRHRFVAHGLIHLDGLLTLVS